MKVKKHVYMPAQAHAHISTCDSGVNFSAKRKWRADADKGIFKMDKEPESSLYLLKCFDSISAEDIKYYWKRNFDLESNCSSLESVAKIVKNDKYNWEQYHTECIEMYQDFVMNDFLYIPESTRANRKRDTGLNGSSWEHTSTKRRKVN